MVFAALNYERSWAEVEEDTSQIARALIASGVRRSDHVALFSTNRPEWTLLQLATARIGAVLVNINPSYQSQELAYVLRHCDATSLFLIENFKNSDYLAMVRQIIPELALSKAGELNSQAFPRLRRVVFLGKKKFPGFVNWPDFLQTAHDCPLPYLEEIEGYAQPEDVVNMQYTSGTTGFPKGAMLTHRNLLMNAFYVGSCQNLTSSDRVCIPVPFYHCFGCVLGNLACVVHGATMVIPHEFFDAEKTLAAIQGHRCTAIYGVPAMFIAGLQHPQFDSYDLTSLRTGIMAGSPCPVEIMKQVVTRMHAPEITIAYGLTESSPVLTQTTVDDPIEFRVATVGRPLPGVEVEIFDPGTGEVLPQGKPGEIRARGHGIMKGYYRMPDQTEAAIDPEGWLHTGDIGMKCDGGYFKITGRLKDMIIRGGENIYPREIEEFLFLHPAVMDVQVVGLPDLKYGEQVSAWIRLKPGQSCNASEIQEFCSGKIARFKIPRYVCFVDSYPTTVTGKIQKFKLREKGIEQFHLAAAAKMETA